MTTYRCPQCDTNWDEQTWGTNCKTSMTISCCHPAIALYTMEIVDQTDYGTQYQFTADIRDGIYGAHTLSGHVFTDVATGERWKIFHPYANGSHTVHGRYYFYGLCAPVDREGGN